jgi:hypothetical protein
MSMLHTPISVLAAAPSGLPVAAGAGLVAATAGAAGLTLFGREIALVVREPAAEAGGPGGATKARGRLAGLRDRVVGATDWRVVLGAAALLLLGSDAVVALAEALLPWSVPPALWLVGVASTGAAGVHLGRADAGPDVDRLLAAVPGYESTTEGLPVTTDAVPDDDVEASEAPADGERAGPAYGLRHASVDDESAPIDDGDDERCRNCGTESGALSWVPLTTVHGRDSRSVRLCRECRLDVATRGDARHECTPLARKVAAVSERDDGRCDNCGYLARLEVHAVVPTADGGHEHRHNAVALCETCHAAAHGERAEEAAESGVAAD